MWQNLIDPNYFIYLHHFHLFLFNNIYSNDKINALFWTTVLFSVVYYYFHKFLQVFLRSHKVHRYKWHHTILYLWQISFNLTTIVFLYFYHINYVAPHLGKMSNRLFSSYESNLFLRTENVSYFYFIMLVFMSFHLLSTIIFLREGDIIEAAIRVFYFFSLMGMENHKLENFAVIMNQIVAVISTMADMLHLIALHTNKRSYTVLNVLLTFRVASWCYVFLNIIPFNYLLPMTYMRQIQISLKLLLWCWYGAHVWSSPVLQYCYHQIYHSTGDYCIGGRFVSRCILLKPSRELKHLRYMQKALKELRDYINDEPDCSLSSTSSRSSQALQTIKCMMTLKRKLKRIRASKATEDYTYLDDLSEMSSTPEVSGTEIKDGNNT